VPDGSKRCGRCREDKTEAGFSPAKWREPAAWCKACHSEYNRQRYLEKGERIRAAALAYHVANREQILRANHERYWRDVEASRARARKSAAIQNPKRREAKQAWARADRVANPEKWRAKGQREYQHNPLARREASHRRRALKLALAVGTICIADLAAKWDYWAACCWMCGSDAVEWDHVKPLSKGGAHCLANLRPACVSCNRRKSATWPFQTA
jgi:5-methylcytosine-specific restriction endonuclease McrA